MAISMFNMELMVVSKAKSLNCDAKSIKRQPIHSDTDHQNSVPHFEYRLRGKNEKNNHRGDGMLTYVTHVNQQVWTTRN